MTAREKWRAHVRRWKESGLTRDQFAALAGLNGGTLAYWQWRLHKEGASKRAPKKSAPPKFIELTPMAGWSPETPERIELVLTDGVVVRVPASFDDETLRRVLGVLHKTGGNT
jgi:hypothetical protein